MKVCAIVLGAGSGKRMGAGINKVFLPLAGIPVIVRSAAPFTGFCSRIIVTAAPPEEAEMSAVLHRFGLGKSCRVVPGGSERQDSVWNALRALPEDTDIVLIHDGARALVTEEVIRRSLDSAIQNGSGIAAVPVVDTIKRADEAHKITDSLNRDELFAMQTPQAFRYSLICQAHEYARESGFYATDDSALLSRMGADVFLSEGSTENIKLTSPTDQLLAELILARRETGDHPE